MTRGSIGLSAALLAVALACSSADEVGDTEGAADDVESVYDLSERLPIALSHAYGAREVDAGLASPREAGFEQRPASVLRYFLAIPSEARLRGTARLEDSVREIPADLHGRLLLSVTSAAGETSLVSQPLAELATGSPLAVDADLSAWAGAMVELRIVFGARPEADSGLRLAWDSLRVERPRAPRRDAPAAPPATRGGRRTNLLVILFDTLRADRLEPYGSKVVKTPNLTRLAARGTTFVNTSSNASWTAPSVASLLSSVYPSVHMISGTGWLEDEEAKITSLNPALPYLPEVLSEAGYATRAIVKNPFFHPSFGYGRGFDEVYPLYQQRHEIRERLTTPESQADAVWEELIEPLLPGETGPPFFVYLHEIDPHHPYDPLPPYDSLYPARWDGDKELVRTHEFQFLYRKHPQVLDGGGVAYLNSQYNGEISFMDAYLGRILARLDGAGLREDTLVVFLSDHGEALTQHGIVGHGSTLYEELLHVPLILSQPGRVPEGARVDAAVELVDLPTTILALLGIEPTDAMQGRNLVPLLTGGEVAERPRFAQAVFGSVYSFDSVRFGDWKLIRSNPMGAHGRPKYELYDLATDPGESQNLASREGIVTETLKQMLAWRHHRDEARRPARAGQDIQTLDAEMRKNLQALGYLE